MAKQKTRTIDADWVAQKQAQTTERLAEMVALAEHLEAPGTHFHISLGCAGYVVTGRRQTMGARGGCIRQGVGKADG